jgi:hypothetical protein
MNRMLGGAENPAQSLGVTSKKWQLTTIADLALLFWAWSYLWRIFNSHQMKHDSSATGQRWALGRLVTAEGLHG